LLVAGAQTESSMYEMVFKPATCSASPIALEVAKKFHGRSACSFRKIVPHMFFATDMHAP
jgi:hypothetical protein